MHAFSTQGGHRITWAPVPMWPDSTLAPPAPLAQSCYYTKDPGRPSSPL